MKETWEPFQSRTSWIQTILTDDYLICFYQSIAAAKLPSAIHSSLPSLPNQISPYFSLNLVLCRWILPTKSWHICSHLFLKFWKWPLVHPMLSVALEWAKLSWALGSKLLCSILLFVSALPEAVSLKPLTKGLMNFVILLRRSVEVRRFGHIPSSRQGIRISFPCFICLEVNV